MIRCAKAIIPPAAMEVTFDSFKINPATAIRDSANRTTRICGRNLPTEMAYFRKKPANQDDGNCADRGSDDP